MLVLLISFLIALLDQASKCLVRRHIAFHETVTVVPGLLNLTHSWNTGAAFGMFADSSLLLTVLSAVMLAVLVLFRRHLITDRLVHRVAMGFMVGGITGNLLDRLRLGHVVDFLDFYMGTRHFWTFNVADTAICTGVGLYLLTQAWPHRYKAQDEP